MEGFACPFLKLKTLLSKSENKHQLETFFIRRGSPCPCVTKRQLRATKTVKAFLLPRAALFRSLLQMVSEMVMNIIANVRHVVRDERDYVERMDVKNKEVDDEQHTQPRVPMQETTESQ